MKQRDFRITLDGTDRLEQAFSGARAQDHRRHFSILQLSRKLATAFTINIIFLCHPELDRGYRPIEPCWRQWGRSR